MRKTLLTFSILIVLGLATGCQSLLRAVLGIKKEEALTDKQVHAYAAQQGWQTLELLRVDSVAYPALRHEIYKPGWPMSFRPLQFLVYSPQGRLVAQYASCEGSLTARTLAAFPPTGLQLPDTTRRLAQLLRSCHTIGPATASQAPSPGEYTIAVYWISWMGRQSTQLVEQMRQYVAAHPKQKIRVVLVNADYYRGMM
jgi:hypothetical protein